MLVIWFGHMLATEFVHWSKSEMQLKKSKYMDMDSELRLFCQT